MPRPVAAADGPPHGRRRARQLFGSEPTSRHQARRERRDEGFLRLPGGSGGWELSHVVDALGHHGDATTASTLEALLEDGGWETPELFARAKRGLLDIARLGLSLDNDPRRVSLEEALANGDAGPAGSRRTRRRVVVVDQSRRDPWIGFDLAGPARYAAMLDAAIAEEPDSEIVVVMDPACRDAGAGHLEQAAAERQIRYVQEPVSAWSVVGACDRLYVVSAHIGLEAALGGRAVTCFGMPFYAGWGATEDRLAMWRRTRRRNAVEIFAAAYLVFSRYVDPYDGAPCSFEQALAILSLVVARDRENAVPTLCLGFARWKRRWIGTTLGSTGRVPAIVEEAKITSAEVHPYGRVVVWASREPAGTVASCLAERVPLLRMEDGFLRSIGLGVGLRPGASYVLDRTGVYYDATGPSDLEALLQAGGFAPELIERAGRLREMIVAARISKYNVGAAPPPAIPSGGPIVLVAGQVEDDASIRLGLPSVSGNAGLLRHVRERHPGAVIAYKPHPDVEAGLRPGRIPPDELAGLADVVLHGVAAPDAIEIADRVEVMTSLIGFEALLRGKPVTTHGLPFYAGWGLTESPASPRRTRRFGLDELVAGALIAYPRYIDPRTGLACEPELLVRRLAEGDPGLTKREITVEAGLKGAWSVISRKVLRRAG